MRRYLCFFTVILLALPFWVEAGLVNINAADVALLDSLPGIGPSKATAIVDYRTQHGFFARIEDIQNVSGIGPSTYDGLKQFITVDDSVISPVVPNTDTSSTTDTTSLSRSTSYVPPPSSLSVKVQGEQTVWVHVPAHLTARATIKNNSVDSSAHILWSFGDGSSAVGSEVDKTYHYPGTYLITATASDGPARDRDTLTVQVRPVQVRILSVTSEGITIVNDSPDRLELSNWKVLSDEGFFRIPEGTTLLPKANVLFPYTVMNIPVTQSARLLYPDGSIAVQYSPSNTPISSEKPFTPTNSYKEVQTVQKSIQSVIQNTSSFTQATVQSYEELIIAPTSTTQSVDVGAPFPTSSQKVAGVGTLHIPPIIRSPWTLGLVGVMALAMGAFVLI